MSDNSTTRSRRCRQRRRDGLVLLPVLVNEVGVEVLLCHQGQISPTFGAKDHDELALALGKLIERLMAADAEQHQG